MRKSQRMPRNSRIREMKILKKTFRGVLGMSPAAMLTGLKFGPGRAYRVLKATLQAYDHVGSRSMSLRDMVRAF